MIKKHIIAMGMAVVAITTSLYTLTGCQAHEGSEDQLKNNLDSFATYYYTGNFQRPSSSVLPVQSHG